jgi:uncharacterized protein
MLAAQAGNRKIVETLLQVGADRNLRNKQREKAADIARAAGHAEVEVILR